MPNGLHIKYEKSETKIHKINNSQKDGNILTGKCVLNR